MVTRLRPCATTSTPSTSLPPRAPPRSNTSCFAPRLMQQASNVCLVGEQPKCSPPHCTDCEGLTVIRLQPCMDGTLTPHLSFDPHRPARVSISSRTMVGLTGFPLGLLDSGQKNEKYLYCRPSTSNRRRVEYHVFQKMVGTHCARDA